jgi:hypothetical protein
MWQCLLCGFEPPYLRQLQPPTPETMRPVRDHVVQARIAVLPQGLGKLCASQPLAGIMGDVHRANDTEQIRVVICSSLAVRDVANPSVARFRSVWIPHVDLASHVRDGPAIASPTRHLTGTVAAELTIGASGEGRHAQCASVG